MSIQLKFQNLQHIIKHHIAVLPWRLSLCTLLLKQYFISNLNDLMYQLDTANVKQIEQFVDIMLRKSHYLGIMFLWHYRKEMDTSGDKDCPNNIYEHEWDTIGLKGSDWVSLSKSKKTTLGRLHLCCLLLPKSTTVYFNVNTFIFLTRSLQINLSDIIFEFKNEGQK